MASSYPHFYQPWRFPGQRPREGGKTVMPELSGNEFPTSFHVRRQLAEGSGGPWRHKAVGSIRPCIKAAGRRSVVGASFALADGVSYCGNALDMCQLKRMQARRAPAPNARSRFRKGAGVQFLG